ncbi:unnamed protein product, partial [Ectocarpus sp. 12 AP-2014]
MWCCVWADAESPPSTCLAADGVAMGESHGPNEGLCCRIRRGGALSAVAAVLAFTSKVSAFVPLSLSVHGFEGFPSSLHPTSASHRRDSSSRRRQSSRRWVGGARGGSSGGMTM